VAAVRQRQRAAAAERPVTAVQQRQRAAAAERPAGVPVAAVGRPLARADPWPRHRSLALRSAVRGPLPPAESRPRLPVPASDRTLPAARAVPVPAVAATVAVREQPGTSRVPAAPRGTETVPGTPAWVSVPTTLAARGLPRAERACRSSTRPGRRHRASRGRWQRSGRSGRVRRRPGFWTDRRGKQSDSWDSEYSWLSGYL
jgi:hypothetical protein